MSKFPALPRRFLELKLRLYKMPDMVKLSNAIGRLKI